MFCSKCGNNLPDTAKFCDKCGHQCKPFNTTLQGLSSVPHPKKSCLNRNIFIFIIGIVMTLILVVGIVLKQLSPQPGGLKVSIYSVKNSNSKILSQYITYDHNGYILEEGYYDETNSIQSHNIGSYEYYENGNLKKEICYYSDGSIEFAHEYDENNNVIKSIYYNGDGSISSIVESEYDNYGNILNYISYHSDNSIRYQSQYVYEYYSNDLIHTCQETSYAGTTLDKIRKKNYNHLGHLTSDITYNKDGSIDYAIYHDYQYDNNNNNLLTDIEYRNLGDGDKLYSETRYEYDENNNLTKEIYLDSDGYVSFTYEYLYDNERNLVKESYYDYYNFTLIDAEITEFDKHGNPLKKIQYNYNADGSINYQNTREYIYDKNNTLLKTNDYILSPAGESVLNIVIEFDYFTKQSSNNQLWKTVIDRYWSDF